MVRRKPVARVHERIGLHVVAARDQQRPRIFCGPEIEDVAVRHAVEAAHFFFKSAQHPQLYLLLSFIPEINERLIERSDFRGHVTHHVKRGIELHLEAGEHAQPQYHVDVVPAVLNGFLVQL